MIFTISIANKGFALMDNCQFNQRISNHIEINLEGGVPLYSWISIDELYNDVSLLEQIKNVATLQPNISHVALMPDAHAGYGMPIGGVVGFYQALSPFCVGVDIGCGMMAVLLDNIEPQEIRLIIEHGLLPKIAERIPVGTGGHREKRTPVDQHPAIQISQKIKNNVPYQLGTLGSGNHYLSIDVDEVDRVWLNIHSGSRALGKEIADHYHKLALNHCREEQLELPDENLAYLSEGTRAFDNYLIALNYALEWAMKNREAMAKDIIMAIKSFYKYRDIEISEIINVHHNYASKESVDNKDVWVHRKGATRAMKDETLLIPGDVATGSWICRGLGSPYSFNSSSHGSGRQMGRRQASKILNIEDELKKLKDAGVVLWTPNGLESAIDEMPGAYKNSEDVMSRQRDLVEPITHLKSMGVIKG